MMNAAQAANFLGISARLIYSMAAPAGPIPCYRIGKRLSFDEQELQEYKDSCRCVQFKMPTPTLSRTFPKLKASSPDSHGLEKAFLKFGVKLKRERTTGRAGKITK